MEESLLVQTRMDIVSTTVHNGDIAELVQIIRIMVPTAYFVTRVRSFYTMKSGTCRAFRVIV